MSTETKTENKSKSKTLSPKYWITVGAEVIHRDFPQVKMYVDRIVKQTKLVKSGEGSKPVMFILGVDCHWIDGTGNFKQGRFLTMELLPWDQNERRRILEYQENNLNTAGKEVKRNKESGL